MGGQMGDEADERNAAKEREGDEPFGRVDARNDHGTSLPLWPEKNERGNMKNHSGWRSGRAGTNPKSPRQRPQEP